MPQSLTTTYRKFYEKFTKIYGEETCIFMLVGKFYELYAETDKKTGHMFPPIKLPTQIMNIVLKEKDAHFEAGVPEQSLHKFAQTLTREGWTVIVVDQVKDKGDEVIDRIPTRVLSPGTHVEIAGQDRLSVAALWISPSQYAGSVMDLTTGEVFSYKTSSSDDLLHMFQVYCVREVIASGLYIDESQARNMFGIRGPYQQIPEDNYKTFQDGFRREEYFRKMFRVKGLLPVRSVLCLEGQDSNLEKSLCVLLRFVEDHFLSHAERLTSHSIYYPDNHMRLSNNILEQLNIITTNKQKSILHLLERTHSAIGKRQLRERILRPITQTEELQKRWNQVEFATQMEDSKRSSLETFLKGLYDMPRLHFRLSEGSIQAAEVLQLFWTYSSSTCLMKNLKETPLECPEELEIQIDSYRSQFRNMFDEEKARQRESGDLCGFLTPMSGPKSLQYEESIQECISEWNRLWNSFCFEIHLPPESWKIVRKGVDETWMWEGPRSALKILTAKSKTTTTLTSIEVDSKKSGSIYFSCKELVKTFTKLNSYWTLLSRALREEITTICDDLWDSVKGFHQDWIHWLGNVDVTLSLASIAKELKWCKPSLGTGLEIVGLRHPLLELCATRQQYVKHDVQLGATKPNGWLIYGVNASGKSSLMKATGIATLLAQAGSFVPATSMKIRPYDAAFSRIWTQDNVWAGLSSFAVEVTELRDILSGATSNSLVLGDEVCSGTESGSATSLVAAVLEHLDSIGAQYIFATHLHDLIKVEGLLPRPGIAVWHLRVERLADGKLIYDRRLQPGPGSCSYGLEVARAMGLPISLMERAYKIRRQIEGVAAANEAPTSTWNSKIQRIACEVCGHSVTRDLEVHHLHERAKGGSNELRNLAVLCETCHDKHHNGEIEVGSLVLTSDGLERSTVITTSNTDAPVGDSVSTKESNVKEIRRGKWTEEEETLIKETLKKHEGRPLTRVITALAEDGLKISVAQLRKFI